MKHTAMLHPGWSTSAIGNAAVTTPHETSALGEHLRLCRVSSGRFFGLRCRAEAVHGFMAARFVTTLVTICLVLVVVLLL